MLVTAPSLALTVFRAAPKSGDATGAQAEMEKEKKSAENELTHLNALNASFFARLARRPDLAITQTVLNGVFCVRFAVGAARTSHFWLFVDTAKLRRCNPEMSNTTTPALVLKVHPIALIGGFGGKGGRATGLEGKGGLGGKGQGNILPAAVVFGLGARKLAAAGGIGGEGGEGKTAGEGGVGGGNEVQQDKWDFGDTTAVAIIGLKKFCQDHHLQDAYKCLHDYGISTANALFELDDEDILALKNSGLKGGHKAGLQQALKTLVAQSKK
ncbi:hypothetical protein B0H16DRAFT_1855814 [Mycena metata]|uniref:Uncharacterized protein n=1 Tax=Mycena metata TaxID=1033252 RepID=A0AAD7INY4_9AGAR|nr:hypothetical protein B0H16DRAFT_1855814 [Mycena metata]